ncbi:hypothetical protein [Mesorhizobium sp. B2-2-4]|nr:hypothetical protein [Mesorhizobium sp. B2-2-4]
MLDRIAEFFVFGFVPLVVGILAVPELSVAAEKALKGEVTYRERIALPPMPCSRSSLPMSRWPTRPPKSSANRS